MQKYRCRTMRMKMTLVPSDVPYESIFDEGLRMTQEQLNEANINARRISLNSKEQNEVIPNLVRWYVDEMEITLERNEKQTLYIEGSNGAIIKLNDAQRKTLLGILRYIQER